MVNRGYQSEDRAFINYDLWTIPGLKYELRGPQIDTSRPFGVAIGAAQIFGRFVPRPFPLLLSERLGMPCLNLGFSGAGPSFFSVDDQLLGLINKSAFAIVLLMSGRSISNSRFIVGPNQGTVRSRQIESGPFIFAEPAYQQFLASSSSTDAASLRAEIRAKYIQSMKLLLQRIQVPTVLMYWSTRKPDYANGLDHIGSYWGAFPHFVDSSVIAALSPEVVQYVEVVTNRGMPQPIFDPQGKPVLLWNEDKFPHVKDRYHNLYYPSPEMHEDAAAKLSQSIKLPIQRRARARRKEVLVHVHIFKNAGSSIDASLKGHFGRRWRNFDPIEPSACVGNEDLLSLVAKEPDLEAISSHQLRFPLPGSSNVKFHPFLLLRHPLDRIRSIYDWERLSERQKTSSGAHTERAASSTLPEFVEWCLSGAQTRAPISNYQTRVCSYRNNGMQAGDWKTAPNALNLVEAIDTLSAMPVVGVVEEFEKTAAALSATFELRYSGLSFVVTRVNSTQQPKSARKLEDRLDDLENQLGRKLYRELVRANDLDLELYDWAKRRLGVRAG